LAARRFAGGFRAGRWAGCFSAGFFPARGADRFSGCFPARAAARTASTIFW
jgi:hypothetical protein